MSALIEARSCERFRALIPYLDAELSKFYRGLLASEERHFTTYLAMAEDFALQHDVNIKPRIQTLAALENDLIQTPDEQFRFHSGCPVHQVVAA